MHSINEWLQRNEPLLRNVHRAAVIGVGLAALSALSNLDPWGIEEALRPLAWLRDMAETCNNRF